MGIPTENSKPEKPVKRSLSRRLTGSFTSKSKKQEPPMPAEVTVDELLQQASDLSEETRAEMEREIEEKKRAANEAMAVDIARRAHDLTIVEGQAKRELEKKKSSGELILKSSPPPLLAKSKSRFPPHLVLVACVALLAIAGWLLLTYISPADELEVVAPPKQAIQKLGLKLPAIKLPQVKPINLK